MRKNVIVFLLVAIATGVVAYLYLNKSASTIDETAADFSVPDTALVNRIFIADHLGNAIDLHRKGNLWYLNDSIPAREKHARLLLRVFKDIEVSSPVPKQAQETLIKEIAGFHRKVEIYQEGSSKPVKTWFVGQATQNHRGTYMLLANDNMKEQIPYITHLRWHRGYITPMFFTDIKEWRSTRMLDFSADNLTSVKVDYPKKPEASYELSYNKMNNLVLRDENGQAASGAMDTLFARDYLKGFSNVHYEAVDHYLSALETDSMLNSQPKCILTVTDKLGGIYTHKFYYKSPVEGWEDPLTGEPSTLPYDHQRDYALTNNGEVVLVQTGVFSNLLLQRSDFQLN